MAQYGNTYVDEKYSSILEPNLYADITLVPGVSFDNKYQGDADAGAVKIYKTTLDNAGHPTTPAGDFSDVATANSVLTLALNNAYRKSKKVYQVTANSIAYNLAEETLATEVKQIAVDRQRSAYTCLAAEGTVSNDTDATASNTLKANIATGRKTMRKAHAKPNVVFASVDIYSLMLEIAGDKFVPITNENMWTNGRVGQFLGMTWYECDGMAGTGKYYNNAGTLTAKNLDNVEFIMLDGADFHIVDNLSMMRVIDSEDFAGVKAQVEVNTGFLLGASANAYVKTKGSLVVG